MHSAKSLATSSAVAASTTRLNASTPPKAETGSHATLSIGVAQSFLLRRAAGIVVLDDDCGGAFKFRGQAAGGFEIDKIVVREFFALKLLRSCQSVDFTSRGNI